MKPIYHVMISGVVSTGVGLYSPNWESALACFLSGIFIDLDHYIDYVIEEKRVPFRYRDLVAFGGDPGRGKAYLIFHSYELLSLFWFLIVFLRLNGVWTAAAIGLTVHILCDQSVNPLKQPGYFFLYRLRCGFDKRELFTRAYLAKIA